MLNLFKLIATISFVISIVAIGVFISRLFYIIEMRSFNIPFFDILKISIKVSYVGGLVGSIGIYFIPYFSKNTSGR